MENLHGMEFGLLIFLLLEYVNSFRKADKTNKKATEENTAELKEVNANLAGLRQDIAVLNAKIKPVEQLQQDVAEANKKITRLETVLRIRPKGDDF